MFLQTACEERFAGEGFDSKQESSTDFSTTVYCEKLLVRVVGSWPHSYTTFVCVCRPPNLNITIVHAKGKETVLAVSSNRTYTLPVHVF